MSLWSQTSASESIGSIASDDVVPTVPTTMNGVNPRAMSSSIADDSRSGRMA
jgi:hypothetical protein